MAKQRVKDGQGERVDPNEAYSYLISKGVPSNHAIGMLANIQAESGFNPTVVGDNGAAVGLFQHNSARKDALLNYTNGSLDWKKQIDYALTEGDTKRYLSKGFESPEQASSWFTTNWERPTNKEQKAVERQKWIGTFQGGSFATNTNTESSASNLGELTTPENFSIRGIKDNEAFLSSVEKQKIVDSKTEKSDARKELTQAELDAERRASFLEAFNTPTEQSTLVDPLSQESVPTAAEQNLYTQNLGFDVQQAGQLFSFGQPQQFATGGTVSELYRQATGKDWSTARQEGLTDGSYEANMALRSRIVAGEFNKDSSTSTEGEPTVSKAPFNKEAYVNMVSGMIKKGETLDSLVNKRIGTKEGLSALFPALNGTPAREQIGRESAATSAPNLAFRNQLLNLKIQQQQQPAKVQAPRFGQESAATSAPNLAFRNQMLNLNTLPQQQSSKVQAPRFGQETAATSAPNLAFRNQLLNLKIQQQQKSEKKEIPQVGQEMAAQSVPHYQPKFTGESGTDKVKQKKPLPVKGNVEESSGTLDKIKELYSSYSNEGLWNTLSQVVNSQSDPETFSTVKELPKKPTALKIQPKGAKFDPNTLADKYNTVTESGDYVIKTFSKKLEGPKLGVRNRGEEKDIKGKAIAYTYAPFKTYGEHIGKSYGEIKLSKESNDQPVIVYDKGKMFIDTFGNQKSTGKKISPTYKTNGVTDLILDSKNDFHEGINQKVMKLQMAGGSKNIPIGISDKKSGKFESWSGGHLMVENPKTKEVIVLHGKSNELQSMFREYLKANKLTSANIVETDHKAYSLIKDSKSKVLTKEFNRERDNSNTNASGSGNFIYESY